MNLPRFKADEVCSKQNRTKNLVQTERQRNSNNQNFIRNKYSIQIPTSNPIQNTNNKLLQSVVYMKKQTKNKLISRHSKGRAKSCQPIFFKNYDNINLQENIKDFEKLNRSLTFTLPDEDMELNNNKNKIVYFQFGLVQKIRVIISDPELTIGWLFCECTRKVLQYLEANQTKKDAINFKIEDFIVLKTKDKIYNLDYL